MGEGSDDFWGAVAGIGIAVLGGFAALAVAEALLGPQCGSCKARVKRGMTTCPSCGRWLQWQ